MKRNNQFEEIANEWFNKGNHDFEDAKRLYKNGGYTDTICFHAHQTAEKYLKGFLVLNKTSPKRVHDLVVLLEDCSKINKKFKKILKNCRKLNKYYIEARYPIGSPVIYPKAEAKEALNMTEKVISFIVENISE